MKKRMLSIALGLIFLSGLSLLLYPYVANEWNTYRQSKLISDYDQALEEAAQVIDYEGEWARAQAYNESLLPSILPDSFAIAAADEEPDGEYMACLNLVGDGIMGSVEIPRIDIKIPIYHTTEEDVLEKAAGHLEGSSLPIGGANTHSVISAHRGLPSAALFTDLDQLEEGDHFLLHILNEVLCYEVDQILVVEPEETQALAVEDGQDLVTLLTCTPYGVNSHRLMVRGHRTDYHPEKLEEERNVPFAGNSIHTNYLMWVVGGLVVVALFVLILARRERRLRKRRRQRETRTDNQE